ncbi:transcription factor e(y)2-domain-containing protein [Tribonema minus]|uniref:Transcription and mRNA export factor ENY2 n=1 Tax=Tribonema minus TaxID=303371 RepID=A0A835YYP0_9STRA|nr:transcription factor e(y)2-domain-containing protein [Tribonema minus]
MSDDAAFLSAKRRKEEAVRASIMQKLVETGEKERLKDLLRDKLIQSGWRDALKEDCRQIISKKGLEKVTVDELVSEITPKARDTVPEEIKSELLNRIRTFLKAT